jgi:hypothetical protein
MSFFLVVDAVLRCLKGNKLSVHPRRHLHLILYLVGCQRSLLFVALSSLSEPILACTFPLASTNSAIITVGDQGLNIIMQ